jgi:hypothetical protein
LAFLEELRRLEYEDLPSGYGLLYQTEQRMSSSTLSWEERFAELAGGLGP